MKYAGMPMGMWALFAKSFQKLRQLVLAVKVYAVARSVLCYYNKLLCAVRRKTLRLGGNVLHTAASVATPY